MRKVSIRNRNAPSGTVSTRESHAGTDANELTSSARTRIPDAVPAGWIDRLLVVAIDLPLFDGEHALVETMVDGVAGIVPAYAVGACFVARAGSGASSQTVVRRLPPGCVESSIGVDPTRIFPGLAHEYVAPVPGSVSGATLHLGSNTDDMNRDRSGAVHLIERASMVLGRALENASAVASAGRAPADAQAVEQRMMQADKLANFGQIAAGVVHELNNPLTSIVAYSDYLARKVIAEAGSLGEEDVERLRRISESATRMLRFTRELVGYARPSSGAQGQVVLHSVIDQAIAFCEHVLSGAGVRVERRYGEGVLTVRAVGEQLVQVFVNLLTNASQAASPSDGRVVVSTALIELADGAKRVTIVVEDNGSGIAPEHLALVFVPFFTTKQESHGTGLGLSIVKTILESHDGAIRVESERGSSTRFIIDLPGVGR